MGSAGLPLWVLPCFWLVGGRSVVFVCCVLPCRFCFARLRRHLSVLFPCDGRRPKNRQCLSGIPLAATAGIVVVAYMDSLRAPTAC